MINLLVSELLANVPMAERNRGDAIEVGITGFINLAHPTRTNSGEDFVRS
jgi:hypothetical protein